MRNIDTPVDMKDSSNLMTLSTTAEWEQNAGNTPVYAVISAVSDASGLDILELPPLYEAINPDALNKLFTSGSAPAGEVSFQYAGYNVTIRGTGVVEVRTTVDG